MIGFMRKKREAAPQQEQGQRAKKPSTSPVAGQRKRKPAGRGALFVITMLFLSSGLIRLGGETGAAIAREVEALANGREHAEDTTSDSLSCDLADGLPELLNDLQLQRVALDARDNAIQGRLRALEVAEAAYHRNLERLVAAEEALAATMARSDSAAENDLARLTAVYENMKPKDASALFATMDAEFAAGFLGRMRPDAAAAVMAGLEPQTAYTISLFLAGRNANAPRN